MTRSALLFLAACALIALVAPIPASEKTHDMTMNVLSTKPEIKMITLKDDEGKEHAMRVIGDAAAGIKGLRRGDRVTVTCQDNEKGQHAGIIAIKPAAQNPAD